MNNEDQQLLNKQAARADQAIAALRPAAGSEFPADVLSVRASKIADEIYAIIADATRGELSNHQLVTAVICRELRKTQNTQAEP